MLGPSLQKAFGTKGPMYLMDCTESTSRLLDDLLPGLYTDLAYKFSVKSLEACREEDPDVDTIDPLRASNVEMFMGVVEEYNHSLIKSLFKYLLSPQDFLSTDTTPSKTLFEVVKEELPAIDYVNDIISHLNGTSQELTDTQVEALTRLCNIESKYDGPLTYRPRAKHSDSSRRALTERRTMPAEWNFTEESKKKPTKSPPHSAFMSSPYIEPEYFTNLFRNSEISNDKRTQLLRKKVSTSKGITHDELSRHQTLLSISHCPDTISSPAALMMKDALADESSRPSKARKSRLKFQPKKWMEESDDETVELQKVGGRGECCTVCRVF